VSNPERLAKAKQFILENLAQGKLLPVVDKTFPFDQIVEAHKYLESNNQFGKIVVTV
jgi:NADPH:quinone reductase-like Zn-dependent oxidoreductase